MQWRYKILKLYIFSEETLKFKGYKLHEIESKVLSVWLTTIEEQKNRK